MTALFKIFTVTEKYTVRVLQSRQLYLEEKIKFNK